MKESGIDWIGQIPEEWEVVRLQDIGDYRKGPFGSAITIDMFIEKSPGSYKVYEQKNAIRGNCEIGEAYIPKSVYNNLKNFSVYPLDIIVSCAGTIGKCYILPEDCEQGIINQALMRVRVNKSVNLEYFLYIFDIVLSYAAIKYSNGSAIKNIPPFNVLNKLRVTLPSNIEQHQIVNYLDKKTAQLDKAKALLEEQIQKLKDYRASLIYETVTKGLDKTVPMKDSGIDWIGQVPEGWGVKRLKYLVEISTGTSNTQDRTVESEGYPFFVRSQNVEKLPTYTHDTEAILTAGDGVGVGKVFHYYKGKFTAHQRVYILSNFKNIESKFLFYYVSINLKNEVSLGGAKSTVDSIRMPMLSNFMVSIPSSTEQHNISNYLDCEIKRIQAMIEIKQNQIENIDKQRQTLIYDYVTGKRRV